MFNSKNAVSQPQTWFEDLSEIQHVEYYLEFSPVQKGYNTTKYAMDLEVIETEGDSLLKIDINYEDLDLTGAGANFNYKIILDSYEVIETSIDFYRFFIQETHSDLLLDLTNIGNSQTFRVDETVIFADYLKIGQYQGVNKLDISFNYIGEKLYNKDLMYNFSTYHYQAYYEWDTQGIV
ncbi:MAG: hypothetical protein KGD74_00530 [Candidatus Lokiarchaeota archaeon]|nr:hypothetical protein [Candidatus Lokiarchaeota archaeon]